MSTPGNRSEDFVNDVVVSGAWTSTMNVFTGMALHLGHRHSGSEGALSAIALFLADSALSTSCSAVMS